LFTPVILQVLPDAVPPMLLSSEQDTRDCITNVALQQGQDPTDEELIEELTGIEHVNHS
jgi:hypothetical protein